MEKQTRNTKQTKQQQQQNNIKTVATASSSMLQRKRAKTVAWGGESEVTNPRSLISSTGCDVEETILIQRLKAHESTSPLSASRPD